MFTDVTDIEPGADFVATIADAVQQCGVLLALIGPTWGTLRDAAGQRRIDDPDDFVALEIGTALRYDVHVIPVLVDGAGMPPPDTLPPGLTELARRHALRIDHERFTQDTDALVAVLRRHFLQLAGQHHPDGATTRATARRWWLAGAGAALAAAIAVPFALLQQSDPDARTCADYRTPASLSSLDQSSDGAVSLDTASYVLDTSIDPPAIQMAGRITGSPAPGTHLWVVGIPDPTTEDLLGHSGPGRFYPSAEIVPDGGGCWRNTESIGYSEAIGITVAQLIVEVDDTADAAFTNRPKESDGFTAEEFYDLDPLPIASFPVPTP